MNWDWANINTLVVIGGAFAFAMCAMYVHNVIATSLIRRERSEKW